MRCHATGASGDDDQREYQMNPTHTDRPDRPPAWPSSDSPSTCWPAAGTPSPDGSACARRPAGWPRRRSVTSPEVVRIDGRYLVHERGDRATVEPITTLAAAAELVGVDLSDEFSVGDHTPPLSAVDEPVQIDDGPRSHCSAPGGRSASR